MRLTNKEYLLLALELARLQRGFCAPNPSVGALIVDAAGNVLSCGYHVGPGEVHAEVAAINNLKLNKSLTYPNDIEKFKLSIQKEIFNDESADSIVDSKMMDHELPDSLLADAIMYVTLEPCCHHGRTPPCTKALISAGIKSVVYAYKDPNPIVSGNGEKELKNAGISCMYFPVDEITNFYESYSYWYKNKLPFVTAKIAMTLDGKIAGRNSQPLPITGPLINRYTHQQRKLSDALLTTVATVISDDPQLNVRLSMDDEKIQFIKKNLYILDSELNIPLNAKVFNTAQSLTIFHNKKCKEYKLKALLELGVKCIPVNHNNDGLDLLEILKIIGREGVHDLWIEAGRKCFLAFLSQQLAQRVLVYIAPFCVGEGLMLFQDDLSLNLLKHNIIWKQFDKDVLCKVDLLRIDS